MMKRLFRGLFGGRTRFARWLRRGVVAVCALSSLVVVARMVGVVRATRDLDRAVAELDRTDPRWRIADILADREDIPDEQNSVVVVMRAHALLPKKWSHVELAPGEPEDGPKPRAVAVPSKTLAEGVKLTFRDPTQEDETGLISGDGTVPILAADFERDDIQSRFPDCAHDDPLGPVLAREIETVREGYLPALEELRKILPMQRSRHSAAAHAQRMGILFTSVIATRELAIAVWMEAYRNIHRGNHSEAVGDIRLLLALARSADGEPFLMAWLMRINIEYLAVRATHRLAYHGSPTEADLTDLERLLAREEAELPIHFSAAIRAERSHQLDILDLFRTGVANPEPFRAPRKTRNRSNEVGDIAIGAVSYPRAKAEALRDIAEMLDLLKKPFPEQSAGFAAIQAKRAPWPADRLEGESVRDGVREVTRLLRFQHYNVCRIRCARACLLAEIHRLRFHRLRFQRLPKSTEELCTSLRVPVLMDPWTGSPLCWKAIDGQLRIYSTGKDGIDDGGTWSPFDGADEAGCDIGFSIPLSKAIRR